MRSLAKLLGLYAFGISQAIGLTWLATTTIAGVLYVTGVTEWMTPALWLASVPPLYLIGVVLYITYSSVEMQLLFRNYEKPRHAVIGGEDAQGLKHVRLIVAYLRGYLVRSLPMYNAISFLPALRQLCLLAYSPRLHIGNRSFLAGFLYDPDLTEIGDDVVIGGGAVLSAHSMTMKRQSEFIYVSAKIHIGNGVTIGGESRIAMGVTIGPHAIVEPASNVVAFTAIPAGEVWGGNPAAFLRKRVDVPVEVANSLSQPPAQRAEPRQLDLDVRTAATSVVAEALSLPRDTALDELGNDAIGVWDSLGQLAIAATLADVYDCRLVPGQIAQLRTMADVERAISSARQGAASIPAESAAQLPTDPEWLPLLPSATAGRLLSAVSRPATQADVRCTVVIAASFTAEPLASSLVRWSSAFGIETRVEFCGFNQIVQALLAPDSLFRDNPGGLNVVLLRPEDLPEAPEAAVQVVADLLAAIRRFATESTGLIVGSLPPPVSPTFAGDRLKIDALRSHWAQQLNQIEGVEVLDFAGAIERVGLAAAGDAALEAATRAPYSVAAFRELGVEIARLVRRSRCPRAKVLALDCDGVLWGGVLAEDGIDGLQLGPDGPGRAFQIFQRAVLRLKQSGILLVLVSRNEESDVLEVLDRHPGMLLRRDDIAAWRINWHPKSQNLKELAAELNLGLDSFVFIDDDLAQRLEVEANSSQIHVFPTPADPALCAEALSRLWIFDTPRLTGEDLARTDMIRQERDRQQQRAASGDMEAYLRSLELKVEMREAQVDDLPRLAQLTQKTNQFNLSLRRRSLDEVRGLSDRHRTFVISASDRFGDYGQIGACILREEEDSDRCLEIDTFLLSCRVLGRGVEDACLYGVFEIARQIEASTVRAPFVEGPRNQPARSFFASRGFRETSGNLFEADTARVLSLPVHAAFRLDGRDVAIAAATAVPGDAP